MPGTLNDTQKPAFLMREPFWTDMIRNPDFACRNRVNGGEWMSFKAKHGGTPYRYGGGLHSCHTFNLPFRGLELGRPVKAECKQIVEPTDIAYPLRSIVEVTYAARKSRVRKGCTLPEVKLVWYDGDQQPSAELMPQYVATFNEVPRTGCLIIGTKGVMVSTNDYGEAAFIALNGEPKMKSTTKHEACKAFQSLTAVRDAKGGDQSHHDEFCEAIKGIGPVHASTHSRCYADVEHSIPMLEGMLVGCVAQQVPGVIRWDSDNQVFDSKAANDLVKPYIRSGWEFV